MSRKAIVALLASGMFTAAAAGQNPSAAPPVTAPTPGIAGVVAAGTPIEVVATGFQASESAIGAPDGSLLFTDRSTNRVMKLAGSVVSVYLDNANAPNGLAFDSAGRLIAVQRAKIQIGALTPSPTLLADAFEGQPFATPNDLVVDKKGGVYFTEFGNNTVKTCVYYIRPDRTVIRVADDIERPNGVQLNRDEKTLYVANTNGEFILAYDVRDDGTIANRREFGKLEGVRKTETGVQSGADGLAIDSEGRVYVTTVAGIQVFSQGGQYLGTIPLPVQAQSLAFAGADKKTLFIVGRGSVFKIPMEAQGFMGRAK
jgi:gluconolactonase